MANHWYNKITGEPTYTVKGKNGKERDTTLADARRLNLVPSVMTIIAEAAAPGLDIYKQEQLLNACLSRPPQSIMDETVWRQTVVALSKEHAQTAAKQGNQVHDALEYYYTTHKYKSGYEEITDGVISFMENTFNGVQWVSEKSFAASHIRYPFGGKVDLHSTTHHIILDFKTKNKDEKYFETLKAYDTHGMQTAAYAVGLQTAPKTKLEHEIDLFDPPFSYDEESHTILDYSLTKRYNLFISTKVPGLMKLTESLDFQHDWDMFCCLLQYWYLRNKL